MNTLTKDSRKGVISSFRKKGKTIRGYITEFLNYVYLKTDEKDFVSIPRKQVNGIGLPIKTGILGDTKGKKHTVLHVSKSTRNSFGLTRLLCEKIGFKSNILDVVGFTPK